ncbi:MAG: hypothetical protein IBJ09_10275 [Bacteroidia bacterium]|nr:hypothetical protein [Bacteroidia bacterium]
MKKVTLSVSAGLLILIASGCKEDPTTGDLPCAYSSDAVLSDRNDGVDYVCNCDVDISSGTFTVEPGVVIEFTSEGGLSVSGNATVKMNGTASDPIVLRGKSSSPGAWQGIRIESEEAGNELSHVQVMHAGSRNFSTVAGGFIYDNKAAVVVEGKAKITHTSVSASGGYGVAFLSGAGSNGFADNTISQSNGFPLFLYAGQLNNTSLASCSFSANTKNYIGIYSKSSNEEVYEEVNFIQTPVPYYSIKGLSFVNKTTMAEGTVLVMANNTGIYVQGNEYLKINGTAAKPVSIRGEEALAGFWRGLLVNTNNPANVFNYLNISDGGSEKLGLMPKKANLALADAKPAQLTINNCTSLNSGAHQLSVSGTDGLLTNNSPAITDIVPH